MVNLNNSSQKTKHFFHENTNIISTYFRDWKEHNMHFLLLVVFLYEMTDASVFILPGTRWCGIGNRATDAHRLGAYKHTDTCCKQHDTCPHSIQSFRKKYGYRNLRLYTISACWCDQQFRTCLKNVRSKVAMTTGIMYFTLLSVPCFIIEERGGTQQVKIVDPEKF
ncbi:acidic phospholipase A2 PA4-like [Hydractinia symbiolongicarpus]|uniref:acidic phospholipase A2 PA4-like n=1 Tax=Hydractinia symbiolongicarpus TaxID=13093 RepID=UPI00255144CC|nr:acidic phospholipase A2 PA4-like [Hydractinia symbiolongicarpus]